MKPLAGCRVLDLGIITAGAATSAMLADLGAEVIKIESDAYRDPFRLWTSEPAPMPGDDLPPFFRMTNRGKLSVSLNLKEPAGRDTFLRLVASSDIVVENFSRGVLQRLGIDYPALCHVQPEIILASISSQGETGPDARYVSFGSTLEAVAGMAWLTGYPSGAPVVSGIELNYPDQVVALFAAGIIVSAWHQRQTQGCGAHLDLSQRDLTVFLSGDAFPGDAASKERVGNAQAEYAVQDCFACADGEWIAVSLTREREMAVEQLTGGAGADALIRWTAGLSSAKCVALLRAKGIVASPVLDAKQVLDQMGGDWNLAMQTMPDGRMVKGFPFQFDDDPLGIDQPARPLGTDTRDVLMRVGGFSSDEVAALIESGVAQMPASVPAV